MQPGDPPHARHRGDEFGSHAWSPDGKWLALVRGTAESQVVVPRRAGREQEEAPPRRERP